HRNFLPQHGRTGVEIPMPKSVAENGHGIAPLFRFFWQERAAQEGLQAQERKEIWRNAHPRSCHRAFPNDDISVKFGGLGIFAHGRGLLVSTRHEIESNGRKMSVIVNSPNEIYVLRKLG